MRATGSWRRLGGTRTRFWSGVLLGVISLYLAARGLDFHAVSRVLVAIHLPYVVLALLIYGLTQLVKAVRWRWLLSTRPVSLSLRQLADLIVIGQAVNLLIPARLGDLARAYLAGDEAHASKAYMLGTIAAEKLLDLVALAVLMMTLVPFIALPAWLTARQGPVLAATATVALAIAALLLGRRAWVGLAGRALARLLGPPGERWQTRLQAGLDGLAALGRPGALWAIWWWTLVAWALMVLTNVALFLAFDLPAAFLPAAFLLVVLQAGVAVPATPGRVGVFDYLCVLALTVFAVAAPVALGYAIVLHLMVVGASSAWAALALWQRSWSLQQVAALDT